ncbi:hypothetical protein MCAP1_000989 [Malassezia caprae]|uniref:Lysophospholipid acyltransferase n=1 Tax=Malassezia caprae TaxID=1381934 RepID=A0AAF0E4Q9_9BASI|nr:hypothetical protein MCAP1_000989 [Malassezia caprae]
MLQHFFEAVGASLGLPTDYAKIAIALLLSFGLSPVLPHLPAPWMRHCMNIGVSAFFLLGILRLYGGVMHLLVACLLTYSVVYFRIGGPRYMPWIVLVGAMCHMLYTHCARELANVPVTTMEISSMQMVLVMNLTSFAWSCYDGQLRTDKDLDEVQARERVMVMPNLLEFFGYCFYFPGVLVGPSSRFREYQAWANGSLYAPHRGVPAGRWREAFKELITSGIALVLMTSLSSYYDLERLGNVNDELQTRSFGYRLVFLQIAGLVARFRFYGVWSLSNTGCILSGLAYNGTDAKTQRTTWTRCKNVYVTRIEFSHNWKELLDAWNANTSFGSVFGTFLTSAIWHGIAPGYYLSFLLAAVCQWLARLLRKSVRPIFFENPRVPDPKLSTWKQYTTLQLLYSAASIVCTITSVNYVVIPFFTLTLPRSLQGYQTMLWHYHVIVALGLVAFQAGLGRALRPLHKARAPKTAAPPS